MRRPQTRPQNLQSLLAMRCRQWLEPHTLHHRLSNQPRKRLILHNQHAERRLPHKCRRGPTSTPLSFHCQRRGSRGLTLRSLGHQPLHQRHDIRTTTTITPRSSRRCQLLQAIRRRCHSSSSSSSSGRRRHHRLIRQPPYRTGTSTLPPSLPRPPLPLPFPPSRGRLRPSQHFRQPKIHQLQMPILPHHAIIRFDISMNHMQRMKIP